MIYRDSSDTAGMVGFRAERQAVAGASYKPTVPACIGSALILLVLQTGMYEHKILMPLS